MQASSRLNGKARMDRNSIAWCNRCWCQLYPQEERHTFRAMRPHYIKDVQPPRTRLLCARCGSEVVFIKVRTFWDHLTDASSS